jgi:hypothetical protein
MTAPIIRFDGLLTTTGNTAAAGDYEVRISAADELRLTGRFSTAGSVLIDSPNAPLIYNFTASQTGADSHWKIQSNSEVTLGRLVDNGAGGKVAQGVQLQAVAELHIQAGTKSITVPAGSKLSVSGDNSRLRLQGGQLQIVGSLLAGATFDGSGHTGWTGRSAVVDVAGSGIQIGGLGPDASGTLVTRGGLLQATGQILLGTSSATSEILINSLSTLETMPAAASALAVTTPTPEIRFTSAGAAASLRCSQRFRHRCRSQRHGCRQNPAGWTAEGHRSADPQHHVHRGRFAHIVSAVPQIQLSRPAA